MKKEGDIIIADLGSEKLKRQVMLRENRMVEIGLGSQGRKDLKYKMEAENREAFIVGQRAQKREEFLSKERGTSKSEGEAVMVPQKTGEY